MHLFTTATSADEHQRAAPVAVLSVGSFEQHGDILPLTTDGVHKLVLVNGHGGN